MIFVLCWLLLRNYKIQEGQIDSGFQNLIKPAIVVLAFYGGNAISGGSFASAGPQPENAFGGFKNPTLAAQLFVWNLNYDFVVRNPYPLTGSATLPANVFDVANLGGYVWIYISAPLIASVCAGLLAKFHFKILDNNLSEDIREKKMSIQDNGEMAAEAR